MNSENLGGAHTSKASPVSTICMSIVTLFVISIFHYFLTHTWEAIKALIPTCLYYKNGTTKRFSLPDTLCYTGNR
jgi:hypothetical protein